MKKLEKKAKDMNAKELASYIDYSILNPEFTEEEIKKLTQIGVKLECASICINPGYLDLCESYVTDSSTSLCPVCDFPFGTSSTVSRVQQIEVVAKYQTVKEIDVVANFGMIRSGLYQKVTEDLKACSEMAHQYGKQIKIILETDALTEEQIRKACHCCMEAQVDFIKTSTGFLTGYELHGATPEVVKMIMQEVNGQCKVKGSGCVRTRERFLELIDLGIDRVGISYKSAPIILDVAI